MPTYIREVRDQRRELLDVFYFCSRGCWRDSFAEGRAGQARRALGRGGASPCAVTSRGVVVHCAECGVPIGAAEEQAPTVVNLAKRPPIDPATGRAEPLVDCFACGGPVKECDCAGEGTR
jgi:hypothetical protein